MPVTYTAVAHDANVHPAKSGTVSWTTHLNTFLLSASDTDAHGKATITLSGATTVTAIIIGGRMTDSIVDFAKIFLPTGYLFIVSGSISG